MSVQKFLVLILTLSSFVAFGETPRAARNKRSPELALAPESEASLVTEGIDPRPSVVDLGLLIGASISSTYMTTGSSAVESKAKVAPNVGLLANFNLHRRFSLETGLVYAPRVSGIKFSSSSSDEMIVRQHILEVPLMARLWLGKVFSFGLGGYVSHAIGDMSISGTTTAGGQSREITNDDVSDRSYDGAGLHKLDYGLTGGIQFRIPVATHFKLLIDTRANYGLRDLRTTPRASTFEVHGHSLRFLAGGAFSF